jgi:carotenoid cleavage dioxygenase-like enzyme
MNLDAGAIATVKLPFRLRSGTHANWMSAQAIAFA